MDNVKELLNTVKTAFIHEFGEQPTVAAKAPGRVNIIGEHTDYNDGFVFPMAVPLYTVMVGKSNDSGTIRLLTLAKDVDTSKLIEFSAPTKDTRLTPNESPKWANYVKGVIEHFPINVPGFDAAIISNVPLGGGLSSSASLEVATCTFLEGLTGHSLFAQDKALLCQKAEHTFAFMPCGIMDQFISCMGQKDAALLIDCRSMQTKTVKLDSNSSDETDGDPPCFLVVNSNVKHELSGSEYPQRRKDCFEAAALIGVKSLRDATMGMLRDMRNEMGDRMYQRALHVVSEIERCTQAVDAIATRDFVALGRLMYQSHVSLRDLYEVSCPELDELVDIVMKVKGVYGARMTGGGFGGCIVALVAKSASGHVMDEIGRSYNGSNGATCYTFSAVEGAEILPI